MLDSFRRAQARYDAMEPPEGVDVDVVVEAAERLAPDYGADEYHLFLRAVEEETGTSNLIDCPLTLQAWEDKHPPEEEE